MTRPMRTYSGASVGGIARQVVHALRGRQDLAAHVAFVHARLRKHEAAIAEALGRPVRGLDVLEIGPGQTLTQSSYFARHNRVTAMDLDVIPLGFDPAGYLAMLRQNGFARVAKTLGRKLLGVDRARDRLWCAELGVTKLPRPRLVQGDVARDTPAAASVDLVMSWSAFEHIPDPEPAIRNAVHALRPGGVLFVGIHLYTSNTGHHDLRAFTGSEESLPLWGHLRAGERDRIHPSSYLNGWRLAQWRALFARLTPGAREFLEPDGDTPLRRKMTPELRRELADYADDELYTDDAFYVWRKPG